MDLRSLVPREDDALARAARRLMAAKMYSLASVVMIYYDLFLTFGDELELIWFQPKYNIMTWLWALNRYVLPLGYIVIVASFHMRWDDDVCDKYVLYPEAMKIVATAAIGVIFILRVRAIFGRDKYVTALVWVLLAAELALKIWAFTDGVRLELPDGELPLHGSPSSFLNYIADRTGYPNSDTVVFGLTLYKTLRIYHVQLGKRRPMSLFVLIVRDGIIYFGVIFAANLANVLVFMLAEDGIKSINASFSTLITSLMVSRLILNLKIEGKAKTDPSADSVVRVHVSRQVETDVFVDERSQAILTLNGALGSHHDDSIKGRGRKDTNDSYSYEMPRLPKMKKYNIPRP
ncbi:hypothetical protein NMY22_g13104 [Coprinellus aureogranulatus]|nr:hypothetical protein NMY22_g13104 [Coprinellus aureogranulatus]